MARIKRTLIVRKKSGESERKDIYTPQRAKRKPAKTMWERAATMDPDRKDLTKGQWAERGDLIRSIRSTASPIILDGASLDDLRDIMYSTTRCQINIVTYAHDKGKYNYPKDRGLVLNVK